MRETSRAVWELTRLLWSTDKARLLGAAALMLAAAVAQPLTALALGMLTDAAVDGEVNRAAWTGAAARRMMIVAFLVTDVLHILYLELVAKAFLQFVSYMIDLSICSVWFEHHVIAEYCDRMIVQHLK